jgi:hypothetical protein
MQIHVEKYTFSFYIYGVGDKFSPSNTTSDSKGNKM